MKDALASLKDATPVALGMVLAITYIYQAGADRHALYCGTGMVIAAMIRRAVKDWRETQ